MATNKTTSKQTTTKKSTAKKSTAARRKSEQEAQRRQSAILQSICVFALGLLFIVMLFVPGQSAWAVVRGFLFGVFGASFYFVGVALLYFAVLVAQQEPYLRKVIKTVFAMAAFSGMIILFSSFQVEGLTFGEAMAAYYQNGVLNATETLVSGGLMGALLGGPLLALCGRPAANILAVILCLCGVMLFTGITPAEIARFVEDRLGSAKNHGDQARDAFLASQEERAQARAARLQQAEEQAAQAQETQPEEFAGQEQPEEIVLEDDGAEYALREEEAPKPWFKLFARQTASLDEVAPATVATQPAPAPRAFFDIDLGPTPMQIQDGESEPIEPLDIGPGGTFGLEAVRGVASVPLADLPSDAPAAPEPDGFWQVPIDEAGGAIALTAAAGATTVANAAEVATQTVPVAAPAAPAAQSGWISMSDAPIIAPSNGEDIAHLAAVAMEKPKLADAALAGGAVALEETPSYQYPPIHLFNESVEKKDRGAEAELKANAQKLVETLESFGVKTRVLDISRGPSVTRYELQPLAGVKISRITNLADDIALNLSVAGVRMEAPIPGKPAVGIEVPNRTSVSVAMRSVLESKNYTHMESPLTFALGKDIAGVAQVADLCKMPHLLVAGSTGSGKSVCMNSIIISFLFRASPDDLKMILIDPKVVELAEYNGIPHLLMPVVTEPRKAAGALGSAVAEMEKRYRLFADNNVRDIKTFNKLAEATPGLEKLPYIAIVIDELADLMMVSGKEVEDYICRIAQKARAAGMHLIVATQRPSVDVITGLIKANIPSRISFAVSSQIDSRTILDAGGAEKLLGMGDMLFMPVGAAKPVRIQGTYVTDEEISRVLSFLKEGGSAQYDEEMIAEMEKVAANQKGAAGAAGGGNGKGDENENDPMLKQCAEVVIEAGQASTSLLQRRCKLGYARAARIMDEMEQLRIIGPYEGSKPRAVLVTRQQWLEMCMNEQDAATAQSTSDML